jgi:hemerythrin
MSKSIKYMEWSDKLSVNVKIIDKQHKHFIGIINELFEAMQYDKKDAVAKIIDELVAYADVHFATEQELFEKYHYIGATEHEAEHTKLKTQVTEFISQKDKDPFKVAYKLLDLLEDWLFNHLSTMDTKYARFLNEQGVH